jgi:putative membrane protein
MFKKYHDLTIALLTGFLVGSLNKIWPWKITTSFRTNSHGEEVPFLQDNILPTNYNGDSQLLLAILMAIIGLVLIVAMEKFAAKKK